MAHIADFPLGPVNGRQGGGQAALFSRLLDAQGEVLPVLRGQQPAGFVGWVDGARSALPAFLRLALIVVSAFHVARPPSPIVSLTA
jgi:hypothetical protein